MVEDSSSIVSAIYQNSDYEYDRDDNVKRHKIRPAPVQFVQDA